MESRKLVFSQTLMVLAGEILLSAVMVGIFALRYWAPSWVRCWLLLTFS